MVKVEYVNLALKWKVKLPFGSCDRKMLTFNSFDVKET
jgi:hypothetical protein